MDPVHIFYTRFSEELPDDIFLKYLHCLPKSLQEANGRYRRWQDRTSNLIGKVLLQSALKLTGLNFDLFDLRFNAFNKPFLSDEIDFSISHSGDYVVCALGIGQKLGVDIEEIRSVHLDDFKQVFTNEQFDRILSAVNPYQEFFRLWTIKESVVKADGRGLSLPLLDIKIAGDKALLLDNTWFVQNLDITDNYCATLAYECEKISISTIELDCQRITSDLII